MLIIKFNNTWGFFTRQCIHGSLLFGHCGSCVVQMYNVYLSDF